MRKIIYFLVFSLLLGVTGCASRDDVSSLQSDMDEVKSRLYQMEKDIGGLRIEAKQGTDNTVKGFHREIENLRNSIADLQAAQDVNRVDIQTVSGKIDDLGQQVKKPEDDLSLLKEDVNRRLTAIETKISGDEKALADAKAAAVTPESMYQSGIDAFKSGDMKNARDIFTKFIGLYPKNDLVANAHYWIGETYYNDKNLEQAILEYQEVIKNFPDKEKATAAMLKQGMSFKELGDNKSARFIFKKLVDKYPKSEEAGKAKKLLKGLK
jgi:tol-pal system protein YbgF